MSEFVRVTIRTEKGKKSFWAIVEARGKNFNLYLPVDIEGGDLGKERKDGVIEIPKELVQKQAIIEEKPAEMNKKYGELEIVKRPKVERISKRSIIRITPKTPRLSR